MWLTYVLLKAPLRLGPLILVSGSMCTARHKTQVPSCWAIFLRIKPATVFSATERFKPHLGILQLTVLELKGMG